eukprot:gene2313-2781_t
MLKLFVYSLLFLLLVHFVTAKKCYFIGNNLVNIYENKTVDNLRLVSCGFKGYSSISFSSSLSITKVEFTVVLWSSHESETVSNIGYIYSNNFTTIYSEINVTPSAVVEIGPSIFRRVFLTIPQKYLQQNYFMILRNNANAKPTLEKNGYRLEAPTEIGRRSISSVDKCRGYTCEMASRFKTLPILAIQLIFAALLVFLSFVGRNWQPMKSRGSSMILGLIYVSSYGIVDLLPVIIPGYSFEFSYDFDIYFYILLKLPIAITIRILILINMLQMVMIMMIKKNYKFISKLGVNSVYCWLLRLFKVLFYNIGVVLMFILFTHIVIACMNFILLAMITNESYHINSTTWDIFHQIWMAFDISFNVFIVILLVFDFALNFKWCKIRDFWLRKDPFYFRLQQIFLLPLSVLSIIVFFLKRMRKENDLNEECYTGADEMFYIVNRFLEEFFFILYFSGFILLLTFVRKMKELKNRKNKKVNTDTIDELFENDEMLELFQEFSTKEFSTENIFLYQEIKKYENTTNEDSRKKLASEIFHKYLNGNYSELEANLPTRLTKNVKQQMDVDEYPFDLFQEVLMATKENLSDTYSRFIFAEETGKYEDALNMIQENTKLLFSPK